MSKPRRHLKLLLIALAIVLVLLIGFVISPAYRVTSYHLGLPDPLWQFRCSPITPHANVTSIEIRIDTWQNDGEEIHVSSNDSAAIEKLMTVLADSKETSDHKCRSIGTIEIAIRGGKSQKLRILPGHDLDFYEYRFNHCINRVDRTSFFDAMKSLGVKAMPRDNSEELIPL